MSVGPARWVRPVAGVFVTAGFLWLLARQVELPELGATMQRLSPGVVLLALACLAAGYFVRVVRWWSMLRVLDPAIALRACGWPFLVSIAVNNILPFRAGDALRVVGFRSQLRAPAMRVFGTLLVERLLDLTTLLALFFAGLLSVRAGSLPDAFVRVAAVMAGAAVCALIALLILPGRLERMAGQVCERAGAAAPAVAWLAGGARDLFATLEGLRSPGLTARIIVLSAVLWTLEGGVFFVIARALDLDIGVGGSLFALASGTLATLIPSSPGYVGTFDYFVVRGVGAYGIDPSAAAAFAVAVHLILWLPLTLAGLVYFVRPGRRGAPVESDGAPLAGAFKEAR